MDKIDIMDTWNEFYEGADHSMKDDFCEFPYPNMEKIVEYLLNGKTTGISLKVFVDVFTGGTIGPAKYKEDSGYMWDTSLPYYVKTYNLRLPKDFEDKILEQA
jgi:hypothetical protein